MKISIKFNIFILSLLLLNVCSQIIELDQGKIQGIEGIAYGTEKYYQMFLGIPYAKPPINELRFQNPEPADKWEGVYYADVEGNDCMQYPFGLNVIIGSEDCLYLNVYTPELPSQKGSTLKPVIVYIHAGAFAIGDGSRKMYTPDFLINYNIVLVTFNYRLHAFGFTNMGIPECTGNFGLKDQTLALKWVKNNIEKFGGDSNNITIFGASAGASSVHYHLVSPLSANLFHKAILLSGNAWSPWAFISNPEDIGFMLAHRLGYEGDDKVQLIEFLKEKSAEEITEAAFEIHEELQNTRYGITTNYVFIPSIEAIKENAFLPDHPGKLPVITSVPVMMGKSEREGIFIFIDSTLDIADKLEKNFSSVITYNFQVNQSYISSMTNSVREFYFGQKNIKDSESEVADLFTDLFYLNLYDVSEYMIKSNMSVYLYNFIFEGNLNFLSQLATFLLPEKISGATHTDELGYLFYMSFLDDNDLEIRDFQMVDLMCRLWTNFAKTGNPTFDIKDFNWKPTTMNGSYLEISSEPMMINSRIHETRISFWKNLLNSTNAVLNQSPLLH